MTRTRRFLSSAATQVLRLVVLAVIVGVVGLTVVQQAGRFGLWWVELTRYLPYTAYMVPCVLAVLVSLRLGWGWMAASVATLALACTVTMGLAWPTTDRGDLPIRLMTYNAKAFRDSRHPNENHDGQRAEVARHDPDILLLQDAPAFTGDWRQGKELVPMFGMSNVFAEGQYMIASKWPLRDCAEHTLRREAIEQRYLQCVVMVSGVAVTLVTAHFESPRAGLMAARHDLLEGVDEWHRNYSDRLAQSQMLTEALRDVPRPLIVGGDLNAPEASPVVRSLLSLGLRDAFSSGGSGYGYSYGQSFGWRYSFLRIDHILVGPEIGVVKTVVGGGEASEHRPVIADVLFKRW